MEKSTKNMYEHGIKKQILNFQNSKKEKKKAKG